MPTARTRVRTPSTWSWSFDSEASGPEHGDRVRHFDRDHVRRCPAISSESNRRPNRSATSSSAQLDGLAGPRTGLATIARCSDRRWKTTLQHHPMSCRSLRRQTSAHFAPLLTALLVTADVVVSDSVGSVSLVLPAVKNATESAILPLGATPRRLEMDHGTLSINETIYAVAKASFRFIIDDGDEESGWEFDVRTEALDHHEGEPLTSVQPRFYSEGDPIPLEYRDDLTGVELNLVEPFDENSGEPYFTFYVYEHGNLRDLTLKFLERDGDRYRISVKATIPAGTVLLDDATLKIATWIQQLPDASYPG